MEEKEVQQLLKKYNEGRCSQEEVALLESWYLTLNNEDRPKIAEELKAAQLNEVWQHVAPLSPRRSSTPLWRKIGSVAALLIIGFSLWLLLRPNTAKDLQSASTQIVVAGKDQAILTLADGKKIVLTDVSDGQIAVDNGTKITKNENKQLIYQVPQDAATIGAVNTITTPRGGQYQVILQDGSKVWLNAASSLTFPTSFAKTGERIVKLEGEAYFEVAPDKTRAFKVQATGQQVEVLGTHFNVQSYPEDGPTKTTLIEGRVKLNGANQNVILKPGQVGYLNQDQASFFVGQANLAATTAWKDGYFMFAGADLYTLMKQISRWYDVEIRYESGVKNDVFFGKIKRSSPLETTLKILELGQVHFQLKGRILTVTK